MFGIRTKLHRRFGLYPQIKDKDGYVARFQYKTTPAIRYGWGKPANRYFERELKERSPGWRPRLERYAKLAPFFARIPRESDGGRGPYWKNVLLPVIDAVSICGMIEEFRPKRFLEIGSGNSTRFACMAAAEFAPQCTVTAIDPYPGDANTSSPDVLIKEPLQGTDLSIFAALQPNDIVWMDGSHHCFSDTDVAAFFLDVLPSLAPGVIVGVHDIPLPWDYQPGWEKLYYNEMHMLAAYLIGGGRSIEWLFSAFHINDLDPELHALLDPIWRLPELIAPMPELKLGGAFWFMAPARA